MRISRKEAKECLHWLELLEEANNEYDFGSLKKEVIELVKILSTIIIKKNLT